MSDHHLELDCDRDGPCSHWQHRLVEAAQRPAPWWLPLIAMTAAAALVAFGVWAAFALLTSMGSYIPNLP